MSIAELSVRRPVTMTMAYVLVIVIACVFIPQLGTALFPSTTMPFLMVSTTYTGVGPEEIDDTVTTVIVNQLKGISGLDSITSTSQTGSSRIQLEFGYDIDLDDAYDDVSSALSRITSQLPDNCGTPSIRRFDSSSMPIMRLGVSGELALDELKTLSEDTIQPLLERVDGVASVDIRGGANREIHIDVIHNRMEAYGISLQSVSSALAARNIQLSSGDITQNGMDYEIITSEYFQSLDDIRQTVISKSDNGVIRVDDVANVYEAFSDTGRNVYINGVQGLYISISNESDSNASTVSKGVKSAIEEINESLPNGVKLYILSDDTTMIDSTMGEVYSSAFIGAFLAILIIFMFLRNIKCAFIIGLSIPICILITLMCMSIMDLTCNMMTMAGLILGMGMVVDSSIVILENIYLHREKGEKPAIASILGSRNMLNAIVASTLTTLCVFIPLLIYKNDLGMIGQMFEEMVITVVISLIASLVVAVTLVPALCGSILNIQTRVQKPLKNPILKKIDDAMENGIIKLQNAYGKALEFSLKNKFLILSLVGMLLAWSVIQITSMGMDLAPSSNADDQVSITVTLPIGTNKDVVSDYLFDFQEIIEKECEGAYETIIIDSGTSNSGSIQINLPELSEQTMSPTDIKAKLKPYFNKWSNVTLSFSAGRGPNSGSKAIDVEVISDDSDAAEKVVENIKTILETSVPQVTDVSTDIEDGSPRYRIVINTEAAAAAGVSVNTIASEIKTAVNGTTATTYHTNGSELDVIVSIIDEDLVTTSDIGALSIKTDNGRMSLDSFITYEEGKSPQKIQRENSKRINHVQAALADGYTTTEVQKIVEETLTSKLVLPDSVSIEYGGDSRDINSFSGSFVIVILLAIFLVFAVMAAQFESLVDPFIIFLSIPLLAIGVIGVYKITGQMFSMYSIVGVVALVGIVVNNGIVLVDYTNQLVDKKTEVNKACIEAGKNRLKPILMSTLTTVLGMVPMAFFPGEGAESMQPICITIVGGLCSGAFMTLFVSPIMYSILNKRREKRFNNPNALINQLEELDKAEGKVKDTLPESSIV